MFFFTLYFSKIHFLHDLHLIHLHFGDNCMIAEIRGKIVFIKGLSYGISMIIDDVRSVFYFYVIHCSILRLRSSYSSPLTFSLSEQYSLRSHLSTYQREKNKTQYGYITDIIDCFNFATYFSQ